ncbi:MAG: hypothetical protein FWF81_10440 [Defluviitaleaceae bacterium]|nr:hypothetical protein [Defluviitaleaceae bacterium]
MGFLPWQARHNVNIMQLVGGKPPNPRAKKSVDFFCPLTTLRVVCAAASLAEMKIIFLPSFGGKKIPTVCAGWD